MVEVETKTMYECDTCGCSYDYEEDAQACCCNFTEYEVYICGSCQIEYDDKSEAEECCTEKD